MFMTTADIVPLGINFFITVGELVYFNRKYYVCACIDMCVYAW